jgi:chromosome segregation ATPase
MDLDTLRKTRDEKEARRTALDHEAEALRADLATVSEATRAAERYSQEKALFAVISPTPEAKTKAEEAKANLTAAFTRETEIRDRIPLVEAAVRKLNEEIEGILRNIRAAENAKVAEVLSANLDQIDAEIVSITGRLLARARARGTAGWELPDLVKDRIIGNGQGSLRGRILAEAEKVRANIASGRA